VTILKATTANNNQRKHVKITTHEIQNQLTRVHDTITTYHLRNGRFNPNLMTLTKNQTLKMKIQS